TILCKVRRVLSLIEIALSALYPRAFVPVNPVKNGINHGGELAGVNAHHHQGLLKNGLIRSVDVGLAFQIDDFPSGSAVFDLQLIFEISQRTVGGSNAANAAGPHL